LADPVAALNNAINSASRYPTLYTSSLRTELNKTVSVLANSRNPRAVPAMTVVNKMVDAFNKQDFDTLVRLEGELSAAIR